MEKSKTRIVLEGLFGLGMIILIVSALGMCGRFLYTGVERGRIEAEKSAEQWTAQCWTLQDINHSGPSRYWILEDQSGERTSLFIDHSCTKEYEKWRLFTVGNKLRFVRRSGSMYCVTDRLTPVRGC